MNYELSFNYEFNMDAQTFEIIVKRDDKIKTFSIKASDIKVSALKEIKDNIEDFINNV